jgi:hypothetical protein
MRFVWRLGARLLQGFTRFAHKINSEIRERLKITYVLEEFYVLGCNAV